MKAISGIEKWSVRLEGRPWKWVQANMVFNSVAELNTYAKALSKDAPYSIALAVEARHDGFVAFNCEPVAGSPIIRGPNHHTIMSLNRLYIPLGFARDVEEWAADHFPCMPVGQWMDFCDLTHTVEEGGDQDRYFAAHFVGPSWWVVPFPAEAETE